MRVSAAILQGGLLGQGILGPVTILAVFNQKGGVGKTTTALNLLAAIAHSGKRPVGIDLDPQGHLSHVFGTEPRNADNTMYGFFMRQRPLAEIAHVSKSGVVVCPAHMELAKLDALLGERPDVIATANIGCLDHLRQASSVPVRHWIEIVDDAFHPATG